MILATFLDDHQRPTLGAVDRQAGLILDLQRLAVAVDGRPDPDLAAMLTLIQGGDAALDRARRLEGAARAQGIAEAVHSLDGTRLLAPLPVPEQVRDFSVFELHMRQAAVGVARLRGARTGSTDPIPFPEQIILPSSFYQQPIYYKGNRFNIVGHEAEIWWPSYCEKFDYELEFAAVIGQPAGTSRPRTRNR